MVVVPTLLVLGIAVLAGSGLLTANGYIVVGLPIYRTVTSPARGGGPATESGKRTVITPSHGRSMSGTS